MTSLLIKLNRNIFVILLLSVIFLSFSLAYLTSVSLSYIFMSNLQNIVKLSNSKKQSTTSIPIPKKKPYEEFESVLSGNIFQINIGAGLESGEQLPVEVKDIELHGVISGAPSFARALIKIKDENILQEYAIGDVVGGNKILKIYYNSILILRGNREMEIAVGDDTSKAIEKSVKTEEIESKPTTSKDQKITIKRSRVIQLTQNQTQLYENKFTPITKDGKILGIKMVFIPTNNFLFELGARSGDIIRRINGQPLDNMNKLMELWQNIQTLNQLTVEIERSGKIIPFEIIIQE